MTDGATAHRGESTRNQKQELPRALTCSRHMSAGEQSKQEQGISDLELIVWVSTSLLPETNAYLVGADSLDYCIGRLQ
jgi:hypothetical protein